MPTQRKKDIVKNLKEKLGKAKALFLTDYRGLTHQQLEQLRKALKKVEADFVIVKNRLLKIAMQQCNNETPKNASPATAGSASTAKSRVATTPLYAGQAIEQLENELKNPTAALFVYGDEMGAIKELANFIKNINLPKVKVGLFEGKATTEADFLKLASLPTREILLATLLVRMQAPISGLQYALSYNLQKFVTVLNNLKDKKPATSQ